MGETAGASLGALNKFGRSLAAVGWLLNGLAMAAVVCPSLGASVEGLVGGSKEVGFRNAGWGIPGGPTRVPIGCFVGAKMLVPGLDCTVLKSPPVSLPAPSVFVGCGVLKELNTREGGGAGIVASLADF